MVRRFMLVPDTAHPAFLWFNGAVTPWEHATFHATSTIWSSMQAVFEGVRAYWQEETGTMHIFRLDAHLRRLAQSSRLVRLSLPYDPFVLLDELPTLLVRNQVQEDTYIRIVVLPTERRMASATDREVINLLADTAASPSHLEEDV